MRILNYKVHRGIKLALKQNKMKHGDIVIFVSASIIYDWGAITIKWGKDERDGVYGCIKNS